MHCGSPLAHEILNVDCEIIHRDYVRQLIAAAIGKCTEPLPDLLTVEQAAQEFNLSKRTVYRLVKDGLPHSKARGAIRIKPLDLQAYLDRQPSASESLFD